ncbi:LAMI_0B03246g1_1 [Lachancea mirantina]|uniref:LAMI_0B03246g1_1 n=1 Tax=Lachancea mirantina TaxID=1230905 RepID=A0A1G4IV38_9SACH|nr:LAMI_0B03246g1_1 [Lachancea mirantina]
MWNSNLNAMHVRATHEPCEPHAYPNYHHHPHPHTAGNDEMLFFASSWDALAQLPAQLPAHLPATAPAAYPGHDAWSSPTSLSWQLTPESSVCDEPAHSYFEIKAPHTAASPPTAGLSEWRRPPHAPRSNSVPLLTEAARASAFCAHRHGCLSGCSSGCSQTFEDAAVSKDNEDDQEIDADLCAEPVVDTESPAFLAHFYRAFDQPEPPAAGAARMSVYEQLLADGPLMRALSKRVKRGYYRCAHCPRMFSNVLEYARHIDEYKITRQYKCPFPLCPWKILGLPRRPELRRHCAIQHKHEIPQELKSMLKLGDTDFPVMQCPSPYCGKKFYRRDSFARHVTMVHDKLDSRFNKRLARALVTCPFPQHMQEHREHVLAEMSRTSKKSK